MALAIRRDGSNFYPNHQLEDEEWSDTPEEAIAKELNRCHLLEEVSDEELKEIIDLLVLDAEQYPDGRLIETISSSFNGKQRCKPVPRPLMSQWLNLRLESTSQSSYVGSSDMKISSVSDSDVDTEKEAKRINTQASLERDYSVATYVDSVRYFDSEKAVDGDELFLVVHAYATYGTFDDEADPSSDVLGAFKDEDKAVLYADLLEDYDNKSQWGISGSRFYVESVPVVAKPKITKRRYSKRRR